jgi:tetratricopeptide (TPR) repeat protein
MQDEKAYPYDVFISYRWVAPDLQWVRKQLYPALVEAGLNVCLDVKDFVPGRDLILEMERAGTESRHVLCVVSPEYLEEGRMVEFESLSARRRDPGGRNSSLIPLILREAEIPERIRGLIPIDWTQAENHEREWQKLLKVLKAINPDAPCPGHVQMESTTPTVDATPVAATQNFASRTAAKANKHTSPFKPIFQAPPLPSTFIDRPEASEVIKSNLVAERAGGSGVLVVSAIHGLGGIGKSTLAASLVRNPQVQERFPDGILWATLGQQPALLSILGGWIQSLGDYFYQAYSIEAAKAHLNNLLQDKALLLVVDDVWNPSDAPSFLFGGTRCRVLITTREATVARVTKADLYSLDVMTSEQALALMEGRLGEITGDAREHALSVAEAVGYLPLALELAAAQVSSGIPWDELRQDLEAEIARLERLDLPGADEETDEATRKRLSLLASFHLSLRRLSDEQRSAFAWLGVLPEDIMLSPAMVATLWECGDERAARDTLVQLRDKALLLPGLTLSGGTITCRLHDLLHDISRKLLFAPQTASHSNDIPGLGLRPDEAHAVLLRRYQRLQRDGQWSSLKDDGYIHNYLTWHLERAGWIEELHGLLREETADGRNAWFEARESLGQTAGFLHDVMRAWHLASTAADGSEPELREADLMLEVRYAIITASLNSLAKNIWPELLSALVEKGVWTVAQGLTYARQAPDPDQKLEALASLVPSLEGQAREDILGEALEEGQLIDDSRQAEVLKELALRFVREGCLEEALELVLAVNDAGDRDECLQELISTLLEYGYIAQALEAFKTALDSEVKEEILAELAPSLIEAGFLDEALKAASVIRLEYEDLEELALGFANSGKPEKALKLAQEINDEEFDEFLWLRLSLRLARNRHYEEALRSTSEIDDEDLRMATLLGITPHLPPELWPKVLKKLVPVGGGVGSHEPHTDYKSQTSEVLLRKLLDLLISRISREITAEILTELVTHAPEPLRELTLQEVFRGIQKMASVHTDAVLSLLIPHLPEHLLKEALQYAKLADKELRGGILLEIAYRYPASSFNEIIEVAKGINPPQARIKVLVKLLPLVPERLKGDVLADAVAALHGLNWLRHADALMHLIPYLSRAQLKQTLNIQEVYNHSGLASALARRKSLLYKGFQQELMRAVQAIANVETQIESLKIIKPLLPEPLMEKLLRHALDSVLLYEGIEDRRRAMAALAPLLSQGLLRRALAAVRIISDEDQQTLALIWLAPQDITQSMLSSLHVQKDRWEEWSTNALAQIALNLMSLGHSERALEIAQLVQDEPDCFFTLLSIAPHLPPPAQSTALKLLRAYVPTGEAAEDLSMYLPCVPNQALRESLNIVWSNRTDGCGDGAFSQVAFKLVEFGCPEAALELTSFMSDADKRNQAFKMLAVRLSVSGFPGSALAAAREIEDAEQQIETLELLVPNLPEALFTELIEALRLLPGDDNKAKGIITLTPYMTERFIIQALELTRSLRWSAARAETLGQLLKFLPPHLKKEVLREIKSISPEKQHWKLSLKPHSLISSNGSRNVVKTSAPNTRLNSVTNRNLKRHEGLLGQLQKAEAIKDHEERIEILGALVTGLVRVGDLTTALEVVWKADHAVERAILCDKLKPCITRVPFNSLYPLWHEKLKLYADKTRRLLLEEMYALIRLLPCSRDVNFRLGIARAVRDTGRWWR